MMQANSTEILPSILQIRAGPPWQKLTEAHIGGESRIGKKIQTSEKILEALVASDLGK